jgi:membrane associated rhomboid family serine protease
MLKPPSLTAIPRYPVTASVSAAAIIVTGMWWMGQGLDGFFMNGQVWSRWELWRALSCTLPHVNFFHLAFNLYWVWTFGTLLERVYGHFRFAAIILLLAFGSSLAEFALFYGGVGLSGVGYGLWGMLWVLEKRDPRFSEAVDQQTSRLFIGWFFLCIALTVTNVMPVGNVAHGMGAALGALLGLAVSSTGALKLKSYIGLAVMMILILVGATVFWPQINRSEFVEPEVERAGLDAMDHHDMPKAVKLLEISTRMKHAPARAWYNLGIAYQSAQRYDEALTALKHAAQMPDSDSGMQKIAEDMEHLNEIRSNLHLPKQNFETNAGEVVPNTQTNQ